MGKSVKLKYTVTVQDGMNYAVINLPAGLTIQQRKLHRSCLDYQINGGYIYDSNNRAKIKFGVAPDNWATRSAIRRFRNAWLDMHKDMLKQNPALKPKWHDYKMSLVPDYSSRGITFYNVPEDIEDRNLPHNSDGITWSVFSSEDENLRTIEQFQSHLVGGHGPADQTTQSVGAITSWYSSRPDLSPVTTISTVEADYIENDPINLLFNSGNADDDIIENFQNAEEGDGDQEGDIFPMYDTRYPPTEIQEVAAAFTSDSQPVSYFTGFNALLGQVFLKIDAYVDTSLGNGGQDATGKIDILFDVEPRGETI